MAADRRPRRSIPGEGFRARKQFGQNFLRDENIIADIVAAIAPDDQEVTVEIGPGMGALTRPVCRRLSHLHAVEIDRDLAQRLREDPVLGKCLTIHETDALSFDFSSLKEEGKALKIFGNLPYNISTPLLFHLLSYGPLISSMTFMLQKEVVDRLTASPGCKDYGRLSVMAQYRCRMYPLLAVPPEAFQPAPKVWSAVVRMEPWQEKPRTVADESLLEAVTAAAFSQRRKTIANSLGDYLEAGDFADLGLDRQLRAEDLTINQFADIADLVAARRSR